MNIELLNDEQLNQVEGGYSWAEYKADWKAGMQIINQALGDAMTAGATKGWHEPLIH